MVNEAITTSNSDQKLNHHYALLVEYRGDSFAGFQLQDGCRSVQGELERAIGILIKEQVRIDGSGRTDSGVHATGQVAAFYSENPLPEINRSIHALNAILEDDVKIRHITEAPDWFHPRFSCLAREYEYLIWNAPYLTPQWKGSAIWVREPLDLQLLNEELAELRGENDFVSFTRMENAHKITNRYVDTIELRRLSDFFGEEGELISFHIRGNAFLHNMIRILVGTLLDRSRGKIDRTMGEVLAGRDRNLAGHTAPAVGLYFRRAYYPPSSDLPGFATLEDYPRFAERQLPP